jgi:hypothetical protein
MAVSVLRKPLLSAEEIRSWPGKGAAIVRENDDSCIVSYGDPFDTSWVYTIDKKRNLIVGLDVHNQNSLRDTIVLNTWYFYWDTAGISLLRLIALRGDTTLYHGGYRFSNMALNDSLPDSLFFPQNRVKNEVSFRTGVFAFLLRDNVLSLSFPSLARPLRVSICALSGTLVYAGVVPAGTDRFVWKAEFSSGRKLPAGKYIVNIKGQNIHFSRGFALGER